MTHINWDDPNPLFFNPKFGIDLQGNPPKGIPLPTYGKYGGPNISGPGPAVDDLDGLFREHDETIDGLILEAISSGNVLTPDKLVDPHATLIKDIRDLLGPVDDAGNLVYDAGAMLYGGFSIFALTGQLAQFNLLEELAMVLVEPPVEPNDPSPYPVSEALNDAQRYMETGLAQLLPEEAGEARSLHGMLSVFEEQFADFLVA